MAATWEPHKETIRMLYMVRNETLKNVMVHMRDVHGFVKKKGQYERQFKKWGYQKNGAAVDWKIILLKLALRRRQGKLTNVTKYGETLSEETLKTQEKHYRLSTAEILFQSGDIPHTPEGFTVCTPQYGDTALALCAPSDATTPLIFIDNLPSLKLFRMLRPHVYGSTDVPFGIPYHSLPSRNWELLGNDNEAFEMELTSVLTQGSGWLSSFTKADNRPSLDIVSARRYSDDGGSSGASKVSRIGETSRVLLSLLHSVINNLLSESQAAEVFEVISNNTNRKLFKALVATPSPESKTIAGMFLPAAIECLDVSLVKAMLATGFDPNSHVRGADRGLLVAAINSCNIDIVRQFLDHGASVNVQSYKWHETPLEAAARTGRVDLVRLLLNAGANLNVPARDHGASVLSSAAYHGDLELMQLLIDAGADVRGPTCRHPGQGHMNTTAIRVAAMLGNLAMAKLLLSYGADVNTLSHAAISGKLEMLQLLLDHGANDVVAALRSANCPERSDVPRFLIRLEIETHGYLHNAFQMAAFRAAIRCHDLELTNRLLDSRMSFRLTPASLTIALDIAVRMGTFPVVELLVARGANVNGQGILQWAISLDRFEIVQLLLRSGADVNAPGVHHKNLMAFALAICRQRLEIARLLLDFGVDMNKQGPSAVIEAIDVASPELLQLVVGAWVLMGNVDMSCTVDRLGKSPLDVAARRATVEMTKILLDNKVYRTGDVSLALPIAIENSNWEVAKLLLASGADIGPNQHKEEGTEGRFYCVGTALDRAAQASHVDMLKILLQYETSADQRSQALQVAAKSGRLDAVRLLLEHGADVNAPPLADLCEFGGEARTALQAAAESGNLELVRCLLDVGADVESRVRSPREEGTALRFAAMIGSISIVTLLIQEGADVNAPAIGEYGRTPVEEAAEEGRLDTVQLLINMGADSAGSSALNYARSRGHDGVVALLLENGFEYQKNVYGLWNDYDDE